MKRLLIAVMLLLPLPSLAETGGIEVDSFEHKIGSQRLCKKFVRENSQKITFNQHGVYRGVKYVSDGYISIFCIEGTVFVRRYFK